MKKLFSTITLLMAFASSAFAGEPDTEDHYDAQFIVTDCGTEHQIPANATEEEACRLLDEYTKKDCY